MSKSTRVTSVYREGDSTGTKQRRTYRRVNDRQSVVRAELAEHGLKVRVR